MRTSLGRRLNAGVLFGLQVHVDPVVVSFMFPAYAFNAQKRVPLMSFMLALQGLDDEVELNY